MKAQLKRIIKWKAENRTIASRIKVLRNKIFSGNFEAKDLNELENLAIKKGRNIARLNRMRTAISQRKSLNRKIKNHISSNWAKDAKSSGLWSELTHYPKIEMLPDHYHSESLDSFTPFRMEYGCEWKLFEGEKCDSNQVNESENDNTDKE